MEYTSSNKRILVLNILLQVEGAILKIQERTVQIHCADDFLLTPNGMEKLDAEEIWWIISQELEPLLKAIRSFIKLLSQ